MTHEEAVQSKAAEGYLLDELAAQERDAFEQHLFDCPICAERVRDGAAMFASGREVTGNASNVRPFRTGSSMRSWLSAAAAALLVVAGYQTLIIPGLREASAPRRIEVLSSGPLLSGVTRSGESDSVLQFAHGQPALLYIDVPPEPAFPWYRVALQDSAGNAMEAAEVSAAQVRNAEGEPLHLLVRPLPAGRYVLVIEGVREDGHRSAIARPSVVVR